MDLFDYMRETNMKKGESPLAKRLRPTSLDEVVGQEHILGKDKLLYRVIQADKLSSIILYGPPGTGKTTLAMVIANTTSAVFKELNATTAGKKDIEAVVKESKDNLGMYGKKTILFVDEIHRFNKAQQDYLLPFVEDGTVILIGATTENPYFEVNSALISRSSIFQLKPLSKENIKTLIRRAVTDTEKGMGSYDAEITEEAVDFLADMSEGDARHALNAVELGILSTERNPETGKIVIDLPVAEECIQRRSIRYDKDGDNHYDIISAFIKSMRGSDPDAAVYYLAKMLEDTPIKMTIIERDLKRCEFLSAEIPRAMVIHGDASNQQLLLEEGIRHVEAFAALTGFDEENIMLSLYAGRESKAKLITKVNRIAFENVIDSMNLGSVIYPKLITADLILQYVRAMQNSLGSNVETLYKIVANRAEALEFRVGNDAPMIGIPLEKLSLKKNLLVACINRNGRILTPRGKDTIEVGDTVIIVTTNTGLNDLKDILA